MKKIIATYLALAALAGFIVSPQRAGAYVYNNNQMAAQLIVDKQIKAVTDSKWHDNLATVTFGRGDLVDFRVIVRNSGDKDLNNIDVRDNLPNYVVPIFYPGKYDAAKEMISWHFDQLRAGEESIKTLRIQVKKDAQLPSQPLTLVNQVVAISGTLRDNDQAEFQVAAKGLPQAGSNVALSGGVIASLFGLGCLARKFGRGEL